MVGYQEATTHHDIGRNEQDFVGDIVTQYKLNDFVNSVHGSMMVEKYTTKFMDLGILTPHLISMERLKV